MKKLLMCVFLATNSMAFAQENASLAFVFDFVRELVAS